MFQRLIASPVPRLCRTSLMISVMGLTLMSCSSDAGIGTSTLLTDPYGSLDLNVHTVTLSTLAPYDTVQLVATPHTLSGAVFPTSATATFTTKDTSITVSASGIVQAHSVTSVATGTFVVATLTDPQHQITHTDTVFISVTDTIPPSPLATLQIKRTPGDSSKIAVFHGYPVDTLFLVATGNNGEDARSWLASTLALQFTSSDPNTATVTTTVLRATATHPVAEAVGLVKGVRPGKVTIAIKTSYYGVTQVDSIPITIGNPIKANVSTTPMPPSTVGGDYRLVFTPSTVTIGVGGTVIFAQTLNGAVKVSLPMDVVFDDSTAAQPSSLPVSQLQALNGSGNIAPLPSPYLYTPNVSINPACRGTSILELCQAARSFPRAGIYHFHSALYGSTGTIVVKAP
jgi:hypothetical protein